MGTYSISDIKLSSFIHSFKFLLNIYLHFYSSLPDSMSIISFSVSLISLNKVHLQKVHLVRHFGAFVLKYLQMLPINSFLEPQVFIRAKRGGKLSVINKQTAQTSH